MFTHIIKVVIAIKKLKVGGSVMNFRHYCSRELLTGGGDSQWYQYFVFWILEWCFLMELEG